jgi:hypothetical protein
MSSRSESMTIDNQRRTRRRHRSFYLLIYIYRKECEREKVIDDEIKIEAAVEIEKVLCCAVLCCAVLECCFFQHLERSV